VGPETSTCKSLAANACQAAKREHVTGPGTGLPCEVVEGHYVSPAGQTGESTQQTQTPAAQEAGHTPKEEEAHNESLETQRREEKMKALGQQKVEEAETQGGEHSIRAGEEKVCYESRKTSEECKSPAEKRQRENEAVAQHEREVASGQLKVTE
jgi:hypothetical protein